MGPEKNLKSPERFGPWQIDEVKSSDLFGWIFRIDHKGNKQYLAGTGGRINLQLVAEILPLLNRIKEKPDRPGHSV